MAHDHVYEYCSQQAKRIFAFTEAQLHTPRAELAAKCGVILSRTLPAVRWCDTFLGVSTVVHEDGVLHRLARSEVVTNEDFMRLTAEDGELSTALGSIPDTLIDAKHDARSFLIYFWSWVVETVEWRLGRGKDIFMPDIASFSLASVSFASNMLPTTAGSSPLTLEELQPHIQTEVDWVLALLALERFSPADASRMLAAPVSPLVLAMTPSPARR